MSSDQQAINRRGYAVGLPVVYGEASLKNALQLACVSLDVRRREIRYGHPQNCQLSSASCDVIERCSFVSYTLMHYHFKNLSQMTKLVMAALCSCRICQLSSAHMGTDVNGRRCVYPIILTE